MSKKDEFIKYAEMAFEAYPTPMNDEAMVYWNALKNEIEEEKPAFTDSGKLILQFLKEHTEVDTWKAKDIAEGLFISSRAVSGAIRKLVNDGYVEKIGKDPTIYAITENGKNIEIE